MARSDNFGFIAVLLIASGVALLSVAQAYRRDVNPATEAYNYLVECATKLTERCGDSIFSYIFKGENELLPECCRKLVLMGEECHEAMVNFIVTSPTFRGNTSITVPRSKKVWKKCVSLTENALSPA